MKTLSSLIGTIVALSGLSMAACSSDDPDHPSGAGGSAGGISTAGMGGMAPVMAPSCADIPKLTIGDAAFKVTVAEFAYCMPIPAVHTCDAKPFPQGTSPTISWTAGPAGTMSYAVVFKDLAVLARTASTDANYNKGYHYVMWNIPATVTSLPPMMTGGYTLTEVPGAEQWSNFNNYAFFGPCPNFDPTTPAIYNDTYAVVVYALPTAKAVVPAPVMGISTVRQMDGVFMSTALAVTEYRGTSNAHASEIPDGVLPPMPSPPCPTDGSTPPTGCLATP